MDITTVKNILGITTNKHDTYLSTVLPLMINAAERYCNKTFQDSVPGDVQIAVAKWCEYNMLSAGVESRSQGVSYSYSTEIPESIKTFLKPHRRVKF